MNAAARKQRDLSNLIDLSLFNPAIRAAANPDPAILESILQKSLSNFAQCRQECDNRAAKTQWSHQISETTRNNVLDQEAAELEKQLHLSHGPNAAWLGPSQSSNEVIINSPLLQAIRSQLPKNAATLLKYGADPNGLQISDLSRYQALFLRFRPDEPDDVADQDTLLSYMEEPQTSPLTQEEIKDRFYDAVAPFWSNEYFYAADYWVNGDTAHSLVEAARAGSLEVFDQVYNAGADASFWTSPQIQIPKCPTPSSLAISTPLHAAIETSNIEMLQHLLELGFDPNIQGLANITRRTTPLVSTILCEPFNIEAYEILAAHPKIDFNIRTPVYSAHILHFAIATLSLSILQRIVKNTALRNAGYTALNHTLLHIACLPPNHNYIQFSSEKIFRSIHEVSNLGSESCLRARFAYNRDRADLVKLAAHFEKQTEVIKYLMENGTQQLDVVDVHGNTAFHYLAGHRCVNQDLVIWLRAQSGGERIWNGIVNMYGYTASDLYEDVMALWPRELESKIGMWEKVPEFCKNMQYSEERDGMKEDWWKEKLKEV